MSHAQPAHLQPHNSMCTWQCWHGSGSTPVPPALVRVLVPLHSLLALTAPAMTHVCFNHAYHFLPAHPTCCTVPCRQNNHCRCNNPAGSLTVGWNTVGLVYLPVNVTTLPPGALSTPPNHHIILLTVQIT